MVEAGLEAVHVSPRMVYVDSSRPDLVDGFTRKTFTAMIEGVRESAIEAGITDPEAFDAGVRDLHRTAEANALPPANRCNSTRQRIVLWAALLSGWK